MVNCDVSLLRTIVVHWSPLSGGSPNGDISGRLFGLSGGQFSFIRRQFFGAATLFLILTFFFRLSLIDRIQDQWMLIELSSSTGAVTLSRSLNFTFLLYKIC